ncbi:MAG: hypothetical protein COU29_03305 [Candidatus Magasanikbacteria bacterium CG10_big_fil_rev_8_21_14_0_10_36_32]|uniref:Thioredoxin-like fold domain-containing protein n=1 Tax=Candidatus Magasanikbacteria bacterium CG10_big_fil_rev_8_21_14_0_10_36_32 TaxID=1974646 RepID=A0A2M6W653_9BACT|nr:MAG: hypothetical protein COU29_03305 [Candidatus Magasanikbacteria bacterium CG10_big_fil_rev_8_21_14_0_10_36_32]
MSEDKKNFFNSLEPKSALIVGLISGILVLCTIGFIVMSALFLSGNLGSCGGDEMLSLTDSVLAGGEQASADVPKTDKPTVELFVMSYCPYGLQMEKAFLPVMDLLKDEATMDIKFVSYAMHGKKEIDENTRQYCIQKEQNGKFLDYMECFTGKDDSAGCLKASGIDEAKMNACVAKSDKDFGITAQYNDQASWLSGQFPIYPVHEELNEQYGVQGSPTLVINGVEANASRSPEAIKQVVCSSFKTPPDLCKQILSNSAAGAGFGNTAGTADASAGCGG